MSGPSLLATLVDRFGTPPENLATEALNYILERSPAARRAMVDIAFPSMPLDDRARLTLTFRTQVTDADGSIPDLVGFDGDQREVLIIEAKFWAGLTNNQPATYLKRLPTDRNATLLVVAPSLRFETIWPELIRRAGVSTTPSEEDKSRTNGVRTVRVGRPSASEQLMMLVSWSLILGAIDSAVGASDDRAVLEDVRQLYSLCARQDTDAFLPIQSRELSEVSPKRLWQYIKLVDDLHQMMVARGMTNTDGLKFTPHKLGQGYYIRFSWCYAYLHTDLMKWSMLRETPIWLTLYGPTWKGGADMVREKLRPLINAKPSRALRDPSQWKRNLVAVPLFLKFQCERDNVLLDLFDQANEIYRLLGNGTQGTDSAA
jgi:hypothetical protein